MNLNILSDYQRSKEDNSDDSLFYSSPRFVHHLDQSFRSRLTQLYRDNIDQNSVILDLMSSWVSHLPKEIEYKKVIGHGMNREELSRNERLEKFWVQDLNINQKLPLDDNSVDTCLLVAAWQYLQYPEEISLELRRIIKPKGQLIVSFSNRAFWTKSPRIWVESSDRERIDYIMKILKISGWPSADFIVEQTKHASILPFLQTKGDPFFSVIANS